MTIDQLKEVMEFVQKYHSFALWPSDEEQIVRLKLFPKMPELGLNIKYIDVCYDTREGGDIWKITFREGRAGVCFHTNHFSPLRPRPKGWKYENLYDLCMAYLKGEFIPKNEFYVEKN